MGSVADTHKQEMRLLALLITMTTWSFPNAHSRLHHRTRASTQPLRGVPQGKAMRHVKAVNIVEAQHECCKAWLVVELTFPRIHRRGPRAVTRSRSLGSEEVRFARRCSQVISNCGFATRHSQEGEVTPRQQGQARYVRSSDIIALNAA